MTPAIPASSSALRVLLCGVIFACASATGMLGQAGDLRPGNVSQYLGDGQWRWTAFINGPVDSLSRIRCVEYKLHPTFTPLPDQKVCDRGSGPYPFGLTRTGWGTFEVGITVTYRTGDVRSFSHMLVFEEPKAQSRLAISAANTSKQVRPGWWNWTVFVQGRDQDLQQIRCVEYTLHPTFTNPVQTVCNRGAGREAFPLSASGWGTFAVKIKVLLRDGGVQELTHGLRFGT